MYVHTYLFAIFFLACLIALHLTPAMTNTLTPTRNSSTSTTAAVSPPKRAALEVLLLLFSTSSIKLYKR